MSTEIAPIDDQLSLSHLSATIAAELAAGLADPEGIKEKYELSDIQWEKLKANAAFRAMLKEAIGKFHGDMNAGKRIAMKAEILLEDALPILDKLVHDLEGSTQSRLDGIKQLKEIAGAGKKDAQGSVGAGFSVNIFCDTGEGKPVRIDGTTIVNDD